MIKGDIHKNKKFRGQRALMDFCEDSCLDEQVIKEAIEDFKNKEEK